MLSDRSGRLVLPSRIDDDRLTSLVAGGSGERVVAEWVSRWLPRLQQRSRLILRDAAAAEEVADIVLTRAYGALRAGQVRGRFAAWASEVVRNECLDYVARITDGRTAELSDDLPEPLSLEDEVMARAQVREVAADASRLPARQRAVLLLRVFDGLEHEAIASRLGISVESSRAAAHAARVGLLEAQLGRSRSCAEALAALRSAGRGRRPLWLSAHLRACEHCRAAASGDGRAGATELNR